MGNLEKVLIVVILATISVITVLAFLESADESPERLDLERRDSSMARSDTGTKTSEETESDPASTGEGSDQGHPGSDEDRTKGPETTGDPNERGAELAAFLHGRTSGHEVENATQIAEFRDLDPEQAAASIADAERSRSGSDPAERGTAAPETPTGPSGGSGAGTRTGPPTSGGEGPQPGTRPSDDERADRDPRKPVAPADWTPGSPRYVTDRTQAWSEIATVVYDDASLAAALRAANTDVAAERVAPGTALWIPTKSEARELAASLPSPDDDPSPASREPARSGDDTTREPVSGPDGSGQGETWHVVQKGETLSEISRLYFGTPNRWREILDANRDRVESDRTLRYGAKLRIPSQRP